MKNFVFFKITDKNWLSKSTQTFLFFLLVIVSVNESVFGQQTTKPVLSLTTVVDAAVKNYPSILVRQQLINVGKAKVEDARHANLPTIIAANQISFGSVNSTSGSYFSLGGVIPSVSGGNRAKNKFDIAGGNIAALTASYEVYNFGAYGALTNEAVAALHIDEAGLSREKYYLTSNVIQNYFDLAKFADLLELQQKNIERAQTIKNSIRAFVINGLKPGVDTSIAEAELSKARLVYFDLLKNFSLIRQQLVTFTGLDISVFVPDTGINTKIQNFTKSRQSPENSRPLTEHHPLIQYYDAIFEDNLAQQNLIKKSYVPHVFLLASTWFRGSSITSTDVYDANPLSGLIYSRGNYLLGAGITYDLMSAKKMNYKLDVQKFRTEVARDNIAEQKTLLDNYLNQADINLEAANNSLKEIPIQYASANAAYQQKTALYNAGLATIVDLTNALYVLNRAETDNVVVQSEVWKAVIQKVYAENRINEFLEFVK